MFTLNTMIVLFGLLLFKKALIEFKGITKYIVSSVFGLLNILLYYTYALAFFGQYFNSKIFTLQIVLGYLKHFNQLITNFSISPFIVYVALIIVPILIFIGVLLLTNAIQYEIMAVKKFIRRHHFNNPPKSIKLNIVAFYLIFGFTVGVIMAMPSKISFLLFNIEEPFSTVFFNTDPFDGKILSETNEDIGIRNAYPKDIDFQKKNVIIFVIDALRSDHLSLFGYRRQTTPFLDSLHQSGKLKKVELSFSVAAESFAGINSILRSKTWGGLGYNNFSIQQLLKDQGYDINFILSGDHTNFYGLKSFYGKNDDIDYYMDGSLTKKFTDPNDDRTIFEGLDNIPKFNEKPAFFHFHLMSVHNLGKRLNEFKKYKPSDRTTFDSENYTNRYDNGILQADQLIKKIFKILDDKGYLEESIVVITGDHGEALGERNKFGHGRSLYTDQILTPILIYDSDSMTYKNTRYATLVDIAPTIVDRLGLPIPDSWEGVSIYSEGNNRQLTYHQQAPHYSIIHTQDTVHNKLIYNSRTGKQELYELNSDLYETNNIIDSLDKEYVNTLRWYMSQFNLDPNKLYDVDYK